MELLDKIRDVVDSLLGGNSPKKEYYYFILNLLSTAEYLKKEHIKKCYKEKMGRDFDDAVLETVLTKFRTTKDRETGGVWYERTVKQEFDEKIPKEAWLFQSKDEIYDICFGDFRKEIRVRFEETLESIKTCATEYHLKNAWELKARDYPWESKFHYSAIAAQVMADVMIERFYANDPTVVAIVLEDGIHSLCYRYKSYCEDKCSNENIRELLYATALRGLHFEKHSGEVDAYTSITEEDCKNVVLNSKHYNKRIEEKPYYKDSIISVATEKILEAKLFRAFHEHEWEYWAYKNVRFVDALYNAVWKEIASEYQEGDTTDVEMAHKILVDYVIKAKAKAEED